MIPKELYTLVMKNAYAIGGFDAGAQIHAFYPSAHQVFPVLRTPPEILPDTPAGSWGLAWYNGRMPDGRPKFAVRDDLVLNSKIAWHEAGHALEEELIFRMMERDHLTSQQAENVIRTKYWEWRGFYVNGTWWDQYLYAINLGTSAGWQFLPGESIAESISAAVGGYVESEWTYTGGKDLAQLGIIGGPYSPQAGGIWARQFWLTLMREFDVTPDEARQIAREECLRTEEKIVAQQLREGWRPFKKYFNFHSHGYLRDTGAAGTVEVKSSTPKLPADIDTNPAYDQ